MKRFYLMAMVSLALSACGLTGLGTGAPPQAPTSVINISRGAVDFALNSFDAALYGLDFAMETGRLQPGSDKAKQIAKAGRSVMQFLGMAEAARDAGSSASYEEAFRNANAALKEFRSLIGSTPTAAFDGPTIAPTPEVRAAILDRAEALDSSRKGDAA